jgi:hypothetical protein
MRGRRLILAALVALAVGLVTACSGTAAAPTPGSERSDDGGYQPAPTGAPGDGNPFPDGHNAIPEQPQLIVYNGSLDLEVADVDASVSQAEALVRGLGGHVAGSRSSDSGDGKSAYVTYRIPAARWSEALSGLKGLATRVANEETSSDDVTAQVVDLEARLANLRATEAALQAIMALANTITDVLKVQAELTQVQGDIESMTAQRDLLSNQAALATLNVAYNPPPVAEVTQASTGWDLGRDVDGALASLVRLGQGLASLLVWLIIFVLPVVVPVVIGLWLVNRLWLRWRRLHPATPPGAGPSGPWPPSM